MFGIILDFIVIICLGVTVGFAVILNRRLSVIYESRQELQTFIDQFTQTMAKTEANVKDLRGLGESVFKTAQEQMKRGEALKDDLIFLIKRGEEIAESLETNIRQGRDTLRTFSHPIESAYHMVTPGQAPTNDDGQDDLIPELRGVR